MKRAIAAIAVTLSGAIGLALAQPAAASAGSYSDDELVLTTQNLALPQGYCGDAHFSVGGSFAGSSEWDVDVTVYDPHGVWAGGDYFYQGDGDDRAGTAYLCEDIDLHGRYRVTAEYETYDSDYNVISHKTVTGYFTFGRRAKAGSSLSRVKTPSGKHGWRVVGNLTRAGGAWGSHAVQLQVLKRGTWHAVATRTTGAGGRVVFLPKPRKGTFRLHSSGGASAWNANSASFKLGRR